MVVKEASRSGRETEDPEGVYDDIMERLMEFSESLLQKQSRLDKEWSADVPKGKLTAHQFLPIFEKLVAGLESCGLGKSDMEKYLGYLRRVGNQWRSDILKYRICDLVPDTGAPCFRGCKTWKEAHKALIEMEQAGDGSRALTAAFNSGSPKKGRGGNQS